MTRMIGALTCLLLFAGCTVETDAEAEQKCRDLVNDWCEKVIGCFVESGELAAADRDSELAECKKTGESTIECGSAVRTSSNYDHCIDTVHATECSSLDAQAKLPSQCKAVIEVSD